MKRFYVIYLALLDDGNVLFSDPFPTFNHARDSISTFLNEHGKQICKKVVDVSKDDFAQLKKVKQPEDCIYVRKNSSLYYRKTHPGTIYNSYSIERYGKVGVTEFNISENDNLVVEESKKVESVEKLSHGVHVTFISELKDTLNRRTPRSCTFKKPPPPKRSNPFIRSLVEGKTRLKNVTPPLPRRIVIDESGEFDI